MVGVLMTAVYSLLVYPLVLLGIFWCWFQWKNWDFIQAARKLPCPLRKFPFFGNILSLPQSWEGVTKVAQDISLTAVASGLYNVCFWCGPLPLVMVHKLEDIQKILTTSCTAEKGDEMSFFKYVGGDGLLTASGCISKLTKRHINPLFHQRNLEKLSSMFNHNSRELVAELAEHVDGKPFNVLHPSMGVALKTVCQLIFGVEIEFNTKSDGFKAMMKVVENIPEYFLKRIILPWLRIDFIFEFLYRKELNEVDQLCKQFTESPIKIAKLNHANRGGNDKSKLSENDDLGCADTLNLIDVYTEFQKKYPQFTERDLKCEIITLYCTGTDTVGLTISSFLLLVGKFQDIQERLYKEIVSVMGQDEDVTFDHIRKMQYLDQVYKETLRWSVTVPYILRKTSEELKLSDCTIPAGNTIIVALIGPHMDPSIYPNPQKFDPDRFSPENSTSRSRHAFIPFSSGSRMCIGKTYSEHYIKTSLVHILRKYRVSTDVDIDNLKKVLVVTLVNSEGYNIKLQNRR